MFYFRLLIIIAGTDVAHLYHLSQLEGLNGQSDTNTITSTTPNSTSVAAEAATTEYVPWLYRFGQKLIPCIDNIPSVECEQHHSDCQDSLRKREMALFCCATCRAKYPNFLPKQRVLTI